MASTMPDVATLLRRMASLGISNPSQRLQAATQNPFALKELLDELQSKSRKSNSQEDKPVPIGGIEDIEVAMRGIEANAAKERELGPARSDPIPRDLFIQAMVGARMEFEDRIRNPAFDIRQAFVGTEKYFSETPLRHLERITLRDMLVRKVHRGKYLLCRVIVPSTRIIAIEVGVEDPEGDVQRLGLYNVPSMLNAGLADLDAVFPVGTILAIREPYLKNSLRSTNPHVRVDSPSDVVFLYPGDRSIEHISWKFGRHIPGAPVLPLTASGWKESGNEHFKASRWLAAAIAYTRGLTMDPAAALLWANRAAAYLKLQYYGAALCDAVKALEFLDIPNGVRRKALFRAGQAQYGLGKFEAAIVHFEGCCDFNTNNSDVEAWICRANARLSEERFGQYDWLRLFLDSQGSVTAMDVADFVGPIEVISLPSRGGGRGVVATRDIKVGELLTVAKPFAQSFPEELRSTGKIMAVNMITKKMDYQCQYVTLSRTVERIYGNPELCDLIFHLYPGPLYPPPSSSYPPPILSSRSRQHPVDCAMNINIALLENVCSNNRFMPQPLEYAHFNSSNLDQRYEMGSPCALYLLPSLFNHACAKNASRIFFREVMVIRAMANINKGDEITLAYTGETTAFTRKRRLDGYNFRCTCWLCEEDRADGEAACQRRDELVKNIPDRDEADAQASHVSIKDLECLIQQVSETYRSTRGPVRPALAFLHHQLAGQLGERAKHNPRSYHQVIVEEIKALEAAGLRVIDKDTRGPARQPRTSLPINTDRGPVGVQPDSCILYTLTIVRSFVGLHDLLRAERWLRAAWWLDGIAVGGGRALFEERYKQLLDPMSSWSNKIRV